MTWPTVLWKIGGGCNCSDTLVGFLVGFTFSHPAQILSMNAWCNQNIGSDGELAVAIWPPTELCTRLWIPSNLVLNPPQAVSAITSFTWLWEGIGPIGLFLVISQLVKSRRLDNTAGMGWSAQSQYGIVTSGLKSRSLLSNSIRYSLCQSRKLLPLCVHLTYGPHALSLLVHVCRQIPGKLEVQCRFPSMHLLLL